MPREKIIHKQGKEGAESYIGFGQYNYIHIPIPTPLCVGVKMLYRGNSYLVHRMWKYVTCKHCLKKKP